jgi:hypothetical protein
MSLDLLFARLEDQGMPREVQGIRLKSAAAAIEAL